MLTKFTMPNGSHMDGHVIYDLRVVHLFKCMFELGPRAVNLLQAPRSLNPALDVALNDKLLISSGCLKPTRRELSPVLSGIPPANLRREHSTFKLALQAQLNTNHVHRLHTLVHSAQSFGTQCLLHARRLFAAILRRWCTQLMESGMGKCQTTGPDYD